jgi:protein-S-isoprenylcysteine O-methyltransferase Ste14
MSETQSKYGGARVRVPPPLVFLALIAAGVLVQRAFWPLELPLPFWPRVIAGTAVTLAGLALALAARSWFKRTGQDPAPWRPSPELIIQGIYKRTRNPMYIGLTVFQLGLGIAVGNAWISALAPMGLLIVHVAAVLPEERYLAEKFGESYLRYKESVRRYL